MQHADEPGHAMVLEGGPAGRGPFGSRFASIGVALPDARLTTTELMASTLHNTRVDLERLTGIRERRVATEDEDSFTLALSAARTCLERSAHGAADIEMLISSSITKYQGGLSQRYEPPLSLALKEALGAHQAVNFDLSNACAGMMSGVFILNDFIRRGDIRCGMVVSGEYISHLGTNAARKVRSILSRQLASLTVGDAGAAVIVERAPTDDPGIEVAGFTTLSEHSRLCLGYPSKVGPGASMYTKARTIHKVAIEEFPSLLRETLDEDGLKFDAIDYVIPHQTSVRAIEKGIEELGTRLGSAPRNVVVNVEDYGNTASTTHFVALDRYLTEGRFTAGDRVMLLSFGSGLEVGVVIAQLGELLRRYGHHA
jgi:3-oxoacyl-[acyl-carrier-protein] synthase-3